MLPKSLWMLRFISSIWVCFNHSSSAIQPVFLFFFYHMEYNLMFKHFVQKCNFSVGIYDI